MAEVFISYSRRDKALVSSIHGALKAEGRETWVDWEGIPPTTEWLAEIRAAIEACDNFLFILSPDSAASEICRLELAHAVQHRKRLIPIVARSVPPELVPQSVAALNWIFFDADQQFDASFKTLIGAIETDFDWVRSHTRLLVRARQWEGKSRDAALLLRGSDLREAESWLAAAPSKIESLPTALHAEFIVASRSHSSKRLRHLIGGVIVALIVSIGLAIYAFNQSRLAEDRRQDAERNAERADKSAADARNNAERAQESERRAVMSADEAERRRQEADERYRQALGRQLAMQSGSVLAEHPDKVPLSVLLAIEAVRNLESVETGQALRRGLALLPRLQWKALHPSPQVVGLRFSPDGQRVVTPDAIWDASTGRQIAAFRHEGRSTTFALSGDGRRMARAGGTLPARVWDARTGTVLTGPLDSGRRITTLALNHDGSLLAAGCDDERVHVWNVADGRMLQTLQPAEGNLSGPITEVAFSADGRFFGASRRTEVQVRDVATWRVVAAIQGPAPVTGFGFSPDGTRILTASIEGPRIFDVSGKQGGDVTFDGRVGAPARVAFSPDGRFAAISARMSIVWEVATGRQVTRVERSDALTFSPDSIRVAVAAGDNTARVIELPGGRELVRMSHDGTVAAVAFSPDGASLATGGADGQLRSWTTTAGSGAISVDGEFVRFIGPHGVSNVQSSALSVWDLRGNVQARIPSDGRARSLTIAVDGLRAAAAVGDAAVLWQIRDGRTLARFTHAPALDWQAIQQREELERGRSQREVRPEVQRMQQEGSVDIAATSRDFRHVLTTRADEIARLWDVGQPGRPVKEIAYARRMVAAFSPDSRWLATWSPGEPVRAWDLRTTANAQLVTSHDIDTLVVSPSGRHVVMVGARDVTMWRVAPARRIASAKDVRHTVVSPDGAFLLMDSVNEASLWHLDSGRIVTSVKCTCIISELHFTPTGNEFVVVADDGELRIRATRVPGFAHDPKVAGKLTDISFTTDGGLLAGIESRLTLTATEDNPGQPRPTGQEVKFLRVWDLRSHRELFTTQSEGPTSFSHDGRFVAAGRRVWEVASGREVTQVASPIVAFSPDSSYLITRDGNRTGVWVRRPGDLMSVACDTIRGMSLIDDWRTFVRGLPYPITCQR